MFYLIETPMAYLARQPQFAQLRHVLQNNPTLLQPILQQIGQSNPRLLQVYLLHHCITNSYDTIIRLLVKTKKVFFSY